MDSQGRAVAGVASPTKITLIRFNEDALGTFSAIELYIPASI